MTAPDKATLDGYVSLFRGRADAYGGWDGKCVRVPVTPASFARHLTDGPKFGVYPAFNITKEDVTEPYCVWGATDIDYTDDPADAYTMREVFNHVGVTAWVERTAHGFHVWVFFDKLVRSTDVRNAFLAAHQVADLPPKEVNPKQVALAVGQVGNYVRLPYPHYYTTGITERFFVDNQNVILTPEAFVQQALACITPAEKAAELAAYYIPPPAPNVVVLEPTADMTTAAQALTPLGKVIWRDGPLEGGDRSSKLQHLVYESAKAGLAPGDALLLLKDADIRWGKRYYERVNGEQIYLDLLAKAYGTTTMTAS